MLYDDIIATAQFIQGRIHRAPTLGVILGSGLGALAEEMEDIEFIPYAEIPAFPQSDLAGHADRLVFGRIGRTELVIMQGRFHFYEGFGMKQIAFPVYVLKQLGIRSLIVTNACGGINEAFAPGDLMLITDHINLIGNNPLIGPNDERLGPRFPDMTEVYSRRLIARAEDAARGLSIPLQKGVYAFFSGPCFETAAEIRAYKALGADAVGMSTVPEATVAAYLGLEVLGISCITNMATGIAKTKHSHEEVLSKAGESSQRFCNLLKQIITDWPAQTQR